MPDLPDEPARPEVDELDELRALAGRLQLEPTDWEQPPSGLWEQIAADAGVPASTSPAHPLTPDKPLEAGPHPQQEPIPIDRGRRRPPGRRVLPLLLGAAAAAIVVVVALVLANRPDDGTVVASTSLNRLGPTGSGDAELVEDDGNLTLRVNAAGLDPGDGFLEVWVIDSDVTKLVSLGPLRPDGTYDLPAGLDPEKFPIVDISVEPLDGVPAHSGDSVLRGELRF